MKEILNNTDFCVGWSLDIEDKSNIYRIDSFRGKCIKIIFTNMIAL